MKKEEAASLPELCCGHCARHPEMGCYSDRTAPCKEYQPGYEPVTLRLKRHVFQR